MENVCLTCFQDYSTAANKRDRRWKVAYIGVTAAGLGLAMVSLPAAVVVTVVGYLAPLAVHGAWQTHLDRRTRRELKDRLAPALPPRPSSHASQDINDLNKTGESGAETR